MSLTSVLSPPLYQHRLGLARAVSSAPNTQPHVAKSDTQGVQPPFGEKWNRASREAAPLSAGSVQNGGDKGGYC